ncbi:MAG TPA: alpha-galactosidase [Kiritimatiellia bacterium]|nr:alpha-galactosidase [Kiritimatiellia bacterium]
MKRRLRSWMGGAFLALSFGPRAMAAWEHVSVVVETEDARPVAVQYALQTNAQGFVELDVQVRNPNVEPVTLRLIDIRIGLGDVPAAADVLFGGTCMGRTPLFRTTVAHADEANARSAMFAQVRVAPERILFIGASSWRVFMPYIRFRDGAWRVQSDAERKVLPPGGTVHYERILLAEARDAHDLLDRFGTAIAAENGIARVKDETFTGWATWDYFGRLFTADDVLTNLAALGAVHPGANLIQIDGGWWTERGDYTSVRTNLPGGIQALAAAITAAGKMPGLHFDGFRGDAAAEICRTHPGYFLHDEHGALIVDEQRKPDRVMRYTFFDYSNPDARAYIADCIRTMREAWGIRYFKVDFMRYGMEEGIRSSIHNLGAIRAHDPSLTSVERFRLGMQAIREAIGPENYFLGCSAFIGPAIGFVDGMRTGADISPQFDHFAPRALGNAGFYYLLGKVFNGDCDYLVFRAAEDEDARVSRDKGKSGGTLTLAEARMWGDFAKLYGNARLASDHLPLLRAERQALLGESMAHPFMDEVIPVGLWDHAARGDDAFARLVARSGDALYVGLFNWEDQPKSFPLDSLGAGATLQDEAGATIDVTDGAAVLALDARTSRVLRYIGPLGIRELVHALSR